MWLCEHDVDQFSLSLVEYYLLSLQRTLRAQPSMEPITDASSKPQIDVEQEWTWGEVIFPPDIENQVIVKEL